MAIEGWWSILSNDNEIVYLGYSELEYDLSKIVKLSIIFYEYI